MPMTSAENVVIDIRPMTENDYPQVKDILQKGMDTGEATYERVAPDWDGFTAHRIMDLAFVAEEKNAEGEPEILGWVTASPIGHRAVFSGVIEDSIYVANRAAGKGVAGKMLDRLLEEAVKQGYWGMHSSVFPENVGSIKLHESRKFTQVGEFHKMGYMEHGSKAGQWRGVVMLERILDGGPADRGVSPESPSASPA